MREELYDLWAAAMQNGYIGNICELVQAAGGAKNIYNMKKEQLKKELGISERLANHIVKSQKDIDADRLDEYMQSNGIVYIDHKSDKYPRRLSNITGRPYGLFVKGSLPKEGTKSVAIVGARECSEYGRLMAEYFGDRLAREQVDIISGMAWGIDGVSQMAAVQAGGHSYGILGCGPDVVYPVSNRKLYDMLITNGNGIISEYAPQTPAVARLFPPRNRIISALCDVLIVVEARAKSGTLITVDMAIDQGKSVMIVPGRITDPLSVGCLNLMREGATVAIGVKDVMRELENAGVDDFDNHTAKKYETKKDTVKKYSTVPRKKVAPPMDSECIKIYNLLSLDPMEIQSIAYESGETIANILVMLTKMEMEGFVKEVSSGYFIRNDKYT